MKPFAFLGWRVRGFRVVDLAALVIVLALALGVYAFKTDLPMAGRYQLSVAAKVQGEPDTVVGKVVIKAVK